MRIFLYSKLSWLWTMTRLRPRQREHVSSLTHGREHSRDDTHHDAVSTTTTTTTTPRREKRRPATRTSETVGEILRRNVEISPQRVPSVSSQMVLSTAICADS
mmetsp:Transcript_16995/g.68545  ORF Transcript_16995/g.68545 Transcript_16995/m.68545 type:complete len:103 (+) Transcript_16995:60-368(+)